MRAASKAVLLSALVFPGLGQIYLKCYRRGIIIALLVVSALGVVFCSAAGTVVERVITMQMEGKTIDPQAIAQLAASSGDRFTGHNIILIFILCCWAYSTVDAFLCGRRTNRSGSQPNVPAGDA